MVGVRGGCPVEVLTELGYLLAGVAQRDRSITVGMEGGRLDASIAQGGRLVTGVAL